MSEANDEVIDDGLIPEDVTPEDGNAKLFAKYGIDPDNASTDDLLKVIQRAEKAEKLIVANKKAEKATPKSELPSDIMTKSDYEMDKFLAKNPEAEQYKDKIETLVKNNKLSREDAYILASKDDKEIDSNREVYAKWVIAGKSGWMEWDGVISIDKFDSLPINKQNDYIEKMKAKHGSVKFK